MKTYRIAGKIIEINSVHDDVHILCRDYLCAGTPDFSVSTDQNDIEYERKKSADEDIKEGIPVRTFSDGYLETLAVYRKIADILIDYDIILFHGSVISVDGEGFLFTAKSGTGKSTHTRLWREYFGDRAFMVNDDKPLINLSEKEAIVYGTPWDGKHRLSRNTSVPLKGLCILNRSEQNHIEKISRREAYTMLIQQVHKPEGVDKMYKLLKLVDLLAEKTNLYQLGCNMEREAAEVAYNGMKGK